MTRGRGLRPAGGWRGRPLSPACAPARSCAVWCAPLSRQRYRAGCVRAVMHSADRPLWRLKSRNRRGGGCGVERGVCGAWVPGPLQPCTPSRAAPYGRETLEAMRAGWCGLWLFGRAVVPRGSSRLSRVLPYRTLPPPPPSSPLAACCVSIRGAHALQPAVGGRGLRGAAGPAGARLCGDGVGAHAQRVGRGGGGGEQCPPPCRPRATGEVAHARWRSVEPPSGARRVGTTDAARSAPCGARLCTCVTKCRRWFSPLSHLPRKHAHAVAVVPNPLPFHSPTLRGCEGLEGGGRAPCGPRCERARCPPHPEDPSLLVRWAPPVLQVVCVKPEWTAGASAKLVRKPKAAAAAPAPAVADAKRCAPSGSRGRVGCSSLARAWPACLGCVFPRKKPCCVRVVWLLVVPCCSAWAALAAGGAEASSTDLLAPVGVSHPDVAWFCWAGLVWAGLGRGWAS